MRDQRTFAELFAVAKRRRAMGLPDDPEWLRTVEFTHDELRQADQFYGIGPWAPTEAGRVSDDDKPVPKPPPVQKTYAEYLAEQRAEWLARENARWNSNYVVPKRRDTELICKLIKDAKEVKSVKASGKRVAICLLMPSGERKRLVARRDDCGLYHHWFDALHEIAREWVRATGGCP